MARFTSSGAAAGAAATLPRKAARVPGTTGPLVGKLEGVPPAKVAAGRLAHIVTIRERSE
jgi:hypothetical protein